MKKVFSLILCLLLGFSFSGCKGKEAVEVKSADAAIYSENYEITKGMVQYFFNSQYLAFYNLYGDDFETLGIDTSRPLSEQECSVDSTKASWYDYFMDITKEKLSDYLIAAEEFLEENPEFIEESEEKVGEFLENLKTTAKKENKDPDDYVKDTFGASVTKNEIIKVMNLELAYNAYKSEYTKKFSITDELLEKHFEQNRKTLSTVHIIQYNVVQENSSAKSKKAADKKVKALCDAQSEEEFLELIEEYTEEECEKAELSSSETEDAIKSVLTDAEQERASYNGIYEESRWAFDKERKAGDTAEFEYVNGDAKNRLVIFIVSPAKRDTYKETSFRNISISVSDFKNESEAEEKAEELLNELQSSNGSAAKFEKLAKEFSSDELTKKNGGLYENVHLGFLSEDMKIVEDWIFETGRREGDMEIIENGETFHILYIESQGREGWKIQAENSYLEKSYSKNLNSLSDNYVITINSNLIYSIDEVDLSGK